ncbi:hypothetical protein TNCV_3798801 [Trichonephila clavipes]|nr:hypothetical protein TNCV_3798801 [Trichonephila clavipes]
MLTPNTHSIGRLGSPSLPSSTPLVPASETPPTSINQVATQGQRQHQTENGGIRKLIPVPCSKAAASRFKEKFKSFESVSKAVAAYYNSKDENFYKTGIHRLPERGQQVVTNNGAYIND